MVSDGVPEEEALRCCLESGQDDPDVLAAKLLNRTAESGQDDATVVTVRLLSAIPEP